ncbi:MAG TPA: putative dsRNA-binding protein, partial [Abditibacteriaceae bacterium]|nr:putative dsRNA-binding protein [Abditibacteriaceae bacterium]
AVFLSSGFEKAQEFALRALREEIENLESAPAIANIKNLLQEKTQAIGLGTPRYQTATKGKSSKLFTSQVLLMDEVRGRGEGRTKKEAEEQAAQQALDAMNKA